MYMEVHGGLVVSTLDRHSSDSGFESQIWLKFDLKFQLCTAIVSLWEESLIDKITRKHKHLGLQSEFANT